MEEQQVYHIPAMLDATINSLIHQPDGGDESGIYIDLTFGGGGHSRALLERLEMQYAESKARLFAFDQDLDVLQNVEALANNPHFQFVHSNFRYVKNFMHYYGISQVDGILADLGVSFHHFDTAERGFSFRFDGPLDMRMNQDSALSAANIVNTYDIDDLTRIFRLWGECQNPKAIAKAIVKQREQKPLTTTTELVKLISPFCGKDKEKKELARVFQALRIEVNDEMGALKDMLCASLELLRPGGRLAILTYHSLEDRLVKNFMRSGNIDGEIEKDFYGNRLLPFKLITNKPIIASEEEVAANPRARSAKLRVAEKL